MPSPFVVAKFGGTSLKDAEAISRSANIVLSHSDTRVVVVSAQAGVTNRLVACANASINGCETATVLREIREIVEPILDSLNDAACRAKVDGLLTDLTVVADMLSRAYSVQLSDELLGFGERISAQLMVATLRHLGADAEHISASKLICTDANFGQAKPMTATTAERVAANLLSACETKIIVTEGFIGSTAEGVRTTLGRGGSDYSAALLAEAMSAKSLMIWTDVAGIYEVDPRLAPSAKPIEEISFNEAAELATFGAKVLHPASLWPAISANIDVFVGSSRDASQRGTWIRRAVPEQPAIRALAVRHHQTLVTVKTLNMLHAQGFLVKLFSVLASHQISVDLVTTSEVSVALTIDNTATKSLGHSPLTADVIRDLEAIEHATVTVESDLSLVGVIGNNLDQTPGVSARLFDAIQGNNVRLICHGASPHNICFLVDAKDANESIQNAYRTFFEKEEACA